MNNHTSTYSDNERYLQLKKSMQKLKKKKKDEVMSHSEAVRLAKEKDETWLITQLAITIFTKIHMTFVWHFALPVLLFKDAAFHTTALTCQFVMRTYSYSNKTVQF